jgi:hypothetical protein
MRLLINGTLICDILRSESLISLRFGNITSPEWWDVLYLNEGKDNYFSTENSTNSHQDLPLSWANWLSLTSEQSREYHATSLTPLQRLFPEWGAKKEFINVHLQNVSCSDQLYCLITDSSLLGARSRRQAF